MTGIVSLRDSKTTFRILGVTEKDPPRNLGACSADA
jgi:hypothetical protein